MRIEIDQRWKTENTNKTTVLAFSNARNGVIIVRSREKKLVQKYFREIGKPRLFAHLCFAALVFILLKHEISSGDQIFIDREYPGYEKLINQKISDFIKENFHSKNIDIHTVNIGKKSRAHLLALETFNLRNKTTIRSVSAREIVQVIKKDFLYKQKSGNA